MKNLRTRMLLVLCLCLTLMAGTTVALAAGYSADIVSTDKKGSTQSKIWVSYSLWAQRMEPAAQPGMILIVRMDKKLIWNIMTKEKMYMEIAMRPGMGGNTIASGEKAPSEVERTYLLTETVEGHVADKYRITHQMDNDKTVHFIWLLKDNNLFPIKTQYQDSITVFKNLVFEEPAATMFEVPAGYQKMNMPFMQ
jgi:hypothetical protein